MTLRGSFFFTILILFPIYADAAVRISEVAWMGSATSHADEWIELHNSGKSAVALDGWTLTDGDTLTISLSGTIPAGAYSVLERTDDESAPGSAFLIYTGALTNSGATLRLLGSDGSVVDRVVGGSDWENIGGDNELKHTAQQTGSGWVTAAPTPGSKNSTQNAPIESDDDTDTPTENTQEDTEGAGSEHDGVGETISLELPDTKLHLTIGAPSVGYVNQPVAFVASASGIGESLIESLDYRWNFGDTYTAHGKEATHYYRFPGTYIIALHAAHARHKADVRYKITILPTEISLSRGPRGAIVVSNEAEYAFDLSGFSLVGDHKLRFPDQTILASNGTLKIDRSRVEDGVKKMIALYDRQEELVDSVLPTSEALETRATVARATAGRTGGSAVPASRSNRTIEEKAQPQSKEISARDSSALATHTLEAAAVHSSTDRSTRAYIFLAGIILLGILGIYARKLG